jgi:dTDP-4-amino-4,6-dideoxygalactose transaminase
MNQPAITIPLMDLSAQNSALKSQLVDGFSKLVDTCAFCLGPQVEGFEKEYANYCGVKHAVATNSGTSALHLALLALGVGPGDDVVTTPYTFVATTWAVSYCGARPVFADIDSGTFLLDAKAAERAITPKTKAILPVHLYGQPVNVEAFQDLAKRKGIPLVEDSCQAHGATYKRAKTGSLGSIGAFSFYPSKNLGACGEGGIATTNDGELAAKMRALREHGSVKRYFHDTIGFNYRMEGVQGMALRVKLPHLDGWNARRQQIAALYNRLLEGAKVRLPELGADRSHVYHLYVIRHPKREKLADFLRARGIGTGMHYPLPIHLQKAYTHLNLRLGILPNSELAARECLSLPLFPELKDEQVKTVADAVNEWSKLEG